MKLSRDAVRRLLTKDETEFVEGLAPGRIEDVTPARLRQKLGRARRLRDKYRDLARRQAGEMRGKAEPRSSRAARSNANTLRKVQVFDWAIIQISGRLDRVAEEEGEAAAGKVAAREPAGGGEAVGGRTREAAEYGEEALRERIVAVLKEVDDLSFGDLWATMSDVPVDLLRKSLWSLSEAGVVDLTDGAGVALTSEADMADDVDVEVDVERDAPPVVRPPQPPPAPRRSGTVPVDTGHHPRTRIRSHLKASGRRNQARRDRRG